jgi:Ca2+-binding RTX toxin-like protein
MHLWPNIEKMFRNNLHLVTLFISLVLAVPGVFAGDFSQVDATLLKNSSESESESESNVTILQAQPANATSVQKNKINATILQGQSIKGPILEGVDHEDCENVKTGTNYGGINGGDKLVGGAAVNDCLYGRGGNDYLIGYAGNDQLFGESGNDKLDAGDGNDLCGGRRW